MATMRTFNIYCDESCHIEHDRIPVMALGAVVCEKKFVRNCSGLVRELKAKHSLKSTFEAKWTKISPAKENFYLELIDLFLTDDRLQFRGLVVPDKKQLNHMYFNQSHNDWYYKMYFTMLRHILDAFGNYYIYLDAKDTQGGPRTRKLHEVLASSLYDFDKECVKHVQQIRSHESELLQIADLLIGALTYANRNLIGSTAKVAITNRLRENFGEQVLTRTSSFASSKFNVLIWRPREASE